MTTPLVKATSPSVPAELEREMDKAIARYPADRKRSAAMPLLHLWQEHFGYISDEGVRWIATKLDLQPINILELVTFYPMYRQAPAGKKHFRVCRTLSCAMAGSYELKEKLAEAAGIDLHQHHEGNGMHNPVAVSADGKYSVEFVECLASCGTAPGLHGRRPTPRKRPGISRPRAPPGSNFKPQTSNFPPPLRAPPHL